MLSLEKIVCAINDSLSAKLTDRRYTGKVLHGLTEPRIHKDQLAPCLVSPSGDLKPIFTANKIPLQVFHRLWRNTYQVKKGTGRTDDQVQFSQMSMIVCAYRRPIRLTSQELESVLISAFPQSFPGELITSMALKSLNTNVQETDHHSAGLFAREWGLDPQTSKALPPDHFILEMRYTIGAVFRQGCLNPCK